MQLQRNISKTALLLIATGAMMGSGWLFGMLYVSRMTGPASILTWMLGGLLVLVVALTFAELSTALPLPGGVARFGNFSHGPTVNFMAGWCVFISNIGAAPTETMAVLQYASNYTAGLMYKVNGIPVLTHFGIVCAMVLMLLMCGLNQLGIKFFSRANSSLVLIKLAIPLLTIAALLLTHFHWQNFFAFGGFTPYHLQSIPAALPLGGVVFSFMGYEAAIQLAGETKNPQSAIPLALIGALLVAILIYALLQTAFIGALDPKFLTHGWAQLDFPGSSGPFAGLFLMLGLGWLVWIIYMDAAYSPFTSAFIFTTSTARLTYALAKIEIFPAWLQKLTPKGVPMRAIFFNYCLGTLFFLPFPTWQSMVSFLVSSIVIAYSIGPLALMALRQSQPELERPFRLPYPRIFAMAAFYVCNLIIFWSGWNTIWHVLITIALGYLFLFRKRDTWRTFWWLIPYLVGIGCISYCGSFGDGKNILLFGWDFLVIAAFSMLIFELSTYCAQQKKKESLCPSLA